MSSPNSNKPKATPGWNDPPMLDHGVKNSIPKSRLGNKRVAFPLSTATPQQSSQQPNLTEIPSAVSANECLTTEDKEPAADDLLDKITANFGAVLSEISDEAKSKDISNKIDVLKNMWRGGTLTDCIKETLYKLSEHIANGNYEEANRLHLQLVMEHATLCGPWIVGVKHLIHKVKQK